MSKRWWTRRRFLLALAGGLAVAGGATALLSRRRLVAWKIERHFHYLELDSADVLRFVDDYQAVLGKPPVRSHALQPVYNRFLLSTDFFPHGADESRPVRYVMLYDPYHSPCYNPLTEGLPDA